MRRILVDQARRRLRIRHGGGLHRDDMDPVEIPGGAREEQLVAIDEALARLEKTDPRRAEVVKLRYFVGMSGAESAEALGVSVATVERDWAFAKAWLFNELQT